MLRQRRADERVGRCGARPATLPTLLAGSDFICSGFGSIQRFDNMFGPSNLNAEDIDDFLAIQRDWGVDGGLRTADAVELERLRRRAAEVARDVYAWFGLADFTDAQVELAVDAAGSKDLGTTDTLAVLNAAHAIKTSGMTGLDVVSALHQCGYPVEAQRLLDMLAARVSGDYLQTAAIFDESMQVLSLVTDPNDYLGPGTGYDPSPARQAEIDAIRQQRSVDDLRHEQDDPAEFARFSVVGPAAPRYDVRRGRHRLVARGRPGDQPHPVRADGVRGARRDPGRARGGGLLGPAGADQRLDRPRLDRPEGGSAGRVRDRDRPAGQGHRADPPARPVAADEPRALQRRARRSDAPDYRLLGVNAGRHAKGATPDPARNPYSDEAIEARYHTRVVALVAIERSLATGGPPEELRWEAGR